MTSYHDNKSVNIPRRRGNPHDVNVACATKYVTHVHVAEVQCFFCVWQAWCALNRMATIVRRIEKTTGLPVPDKLPSFRGTGAFVSLEIHVELFQLTEHVL